MKEELSGEMEYKIMEAATRAFIQKGFAGTSMQDIANEAGINRTSLNYYFRSKQKLFDLVFEKVTNSLLTGFIVVVKSDEHIFEKFRRIIDIYFNLLVENPLFPIFILHEITVNPELMISTLKQKGLNPEEIIANIQEAMDQGILKKTDPRDLMVNLLGLIIFPFVARPMLEGLIFRNDRMATKEFLLNRRDYLKSYFIESVKA